jgi:hydrogenase 3 maturation protease
VAVVGIGQELRGDDAVGVKAARTLLRRQRAGGDTSRPVSLLVVEAGPMPESCAGPLRRFAPDLVILVDAADMGAVPGTVAWLDWRDADAAAASTHGLPLSLFAGYLTTEIGCTVLLLGIQPADLTFGAPLSPPVRRALRSVTQGLTTLLSGAGEPTRPEGAEA